MERIPDVHGHTLKGDEEKVLICKLECTHPEYSTKITVVVSLVLNHIIEPHHHIEQRANPYFSETKNKTQRRERQ